MLPKSSYETSVTLPLRHYFLFDIEEPTPPLLLKNLKLALITSHYTKAFMGWSRKLISVSWLLAGVENMLINLSRTYNNSKKYIILYSI